LARIFSFFIRVNLRISAAKFYFSLHGEGGIRPAGRLRSAIAGGALRLRQKIGDLLLVIGAYSGVAKILLTRLFGIIPFLFRVNSKLNAQKYQLVCPVALSALSLQLSDNFRNYSACF